LNSLHGEVFVRLMAALPKGHADDTMLVFLSKDLNEISEHATDVAAVVMFAGDCKEITHMDMPERRTTH
jgi:hypothetical protein